MPVLSRKEKWLTCLLLVAYISSWFLPIISVAGKPSIVGYSGAAFAFRGLREGLNYLVTGQSNGFKNLVDAVLAIYAGLNNMLFVICFPLLFFKPKWAYFLSPLMVLSMAVWFTMANNIGFYIWLICGITIVLISATRVKKDFLLSNRQLFTTTWSLPIYLPLGLLILIVTIHKISVIQGSF